MKYSIQDTPHSNKPLCVWFKDFPLSLIGSGRLRVKVSVLVTMNDDGRGADTDYGMLRSCTCDVAVTVRDSER